MAWIESHQSLRDHRKTLYAAEAMRMDKYKLIGHLHCLWWWALDNADIDGNLPPGTTAKVLANGAGISQQSAEKFKKSLENAGFLEEIDGHLRLHDWEDYAGKLMANRISNRIRQKKHRNQLRNSDITVTSQVRHGATNQPNQPTNSSKCDISVNNDKEETVFSIVSDSAIKTYGRMLSSKETVALQDNANEFGAAILDKAVTLSAKESDQSKRNILYALGIARRLKSFAVEDKDRAPEEDADALYPLLN